MTNHRDVADWFSLTFEHSADVFCCHQIATQTDSPSPKINSLTLADAVSAHPPTDKAVPPGNN